MLVSSVLRCYTLEKREQAARRCDRAHGGGMNTVPPTTAAEDIEQYDGSGWW
jgi:hypothetical protein